jgi:hypothetical protein
MGDTLTTHHHITCHISGTSEKFACSWAFRVVIPPDGRAPMERGWRQVTLRMRSEPPDLIFERQKLAPNASSLGLRPHLTPPLPRRDQRAWIDGVSSLRLRRERISRVIDGPVDSSRAESGRQ